MKTLLFLLLIGAIAVTGGWQHYRGGEKSTEGQRAAALAERSRAIAIEVNDAMAAKAGEKKLTPDNIREELAQTGAVVRTRASSQGEIIDDAWIVTVIRSKYVVEKNLSTSDLSIECRNGEVKLNGSVNSADQIGQAVGLALQTSGVHTVVARVALKT